MRVFYTLILLFCVTLVNTQITFESRDIRLGERYYNGVAMGVYDVNNDFLDDIVHLDNARHLMIEFQTSPGVFDLQVDLGDLQSGNEWSCAVSDVNNDGFAEVMTAGGYNLLRTYLFSDRSNDFDRYVIPVPAIFSQASNFVDINNDGWLDAFVCHDDGPSVIAFNQGDGTFADSSHLIDMSSTPPSDGSGNYGSVWTDIDSDGDLDLYIAKCRQGVDNPNDGRRINQLFINDGEGNFEEMAEEMGLAINDQSWIADFGDFDNDGDMDGLIANHYAPTKLMINQGDTFFVDEAEARGVIVDGFPIQGLFRDFDNDGYLDIIVTGTRHHIFINNQAGGFDLFTDRFDENQIESIGIGDLNNDGFLDLYAGYAQIFNIPSNIHDRIWINNGNENGFLKLKLIGTESNRAAIGARVELFTPTGRQIREIRAGESYGITNSQTVHFGLGLEAEIDSCVIYWPSGLRQVVDVEPSSYVSVTEGACQSNPQIISIDGSPILCDGDSLEASIDDLDQSLVWNTGDSAATLNISEDGLYRAMYTDNLGCVHLSEPIFVEREPDQTPIIDYNGLSELCVGEEAVLTASPSANYLWNTGDTVQKLVIYESGTYSLEVEGACRTFRSDSLTLEFREASIANVKGDTVKTGEAVNLVASGEGQLMWFESPGDTEPILVGDTLSLDSIEMDTTFYVQSRVIIPGDTLAGGETAHRGESFYNGPNTNGGLVFDIHEQAYLESVTVYTTEKADRALVIRDQSGDLVWTDTFTVLIGENVLHIGATLNVGDDYIMTTNGAINVQSLGSESPVLYRNEDLTDFPYEVGGKLTIKNSFFGTGYYYYFYNWRISTDSKVCESPLVPVSVVVDTSTTSIFNVVGGPEVSIYPNPVRDQLELVFGEDISYISVIDVNGRLIYRRVLGSMTRRMSIPVSSWSAGIYTILVEADSGVARRRVVKVE